MNTTTQDSNRKICDGITQLQADLEAVFKGILEKAGSKLQLEKQEEVQQKIEYTKQILEIFKNRYA